MDIDAMRNELRTVLLGSTCLEVKRLETVWSFKIGCVVLIVECPWRIIVNDQVALSDFDHNQVFGRTIPVDAAQSAMGLLAGIVESAAISPVASDLLISFSSGAKLEVWTYSSGYESWHCYLAGQLEIHITGGGGVTVFSP